MSTIYREGDCYEEVQAFRQLAFGKPVRLPTWPAYTVSVYMALVKRGLADDLGDGVFIISDEGRAIAEKEAADRLDTKALVPVLPTKRKSKPRFVDRRKYPKYVSGMTTAEYVKDFCCLNSLKYP